MKREEVVGKTITRVMRDDAVIERGEPPVPGISDGVMRFFHVFLELDGRDLLEVGIDRRYYPLKFVSNDIRQRLTDLPLPQGVCGCIGEVVTNVVTVHEQISIRLSSGHYFSVENDLGGTAVYVDNAEDFPEGPLEDYWG